MSKECIHFFGHCVLKMLIYLVEANTDLFIDIPFGSSCTVQNKSTLQLKKHLHTSNILQCLRHEQIGVNKFL